MVMVLPAGFGRPVACRVPSVRRSMPPLARRLDDRTVGIEAVDVEPVAEAAGDQRAGQQADDAPQRDAGPAFGQAGAVDVPGRADRQARVKCAPGDVEAAPDRAVEETGHERQEREQADATPAGREEAEAEPGGGDGGRQAEGEAVQGGAGQHQPKRGEKHQALGRDDQPPAEVRARSRRHDAVSSSTSAASDRPGGRTAPGKTVFERNMGKAINRGTA
jgi:hypothetical protein